MVAGIFLSIACNTNENNSPASDTATTHLPDSMPVVTPPITDSSSIITTPPVNDDNVIMPDSSRRGL